AFGDDGAGQEAVLAAPLAERRQTEPAEALRRAERDHDSAAAVASDALAALHPWHGTPPASTAVHLPTDDRLSAWQGDREPLRNDLATTTHNISVLEQDIASMTGAMGSATARVISFADAAAARTRREAFWATHMTQLTPASAEDF